MHAPHLARRARLERETDRTVEAEEGLRIDSFRHDGCIRHLFL